MTYAPQIPYERSKIKPTADEAKSQWVCLHNQRQYLLPIVSRYQTVVPTFNDDGTVSVEVKQKDQELTPLIEGFYDLMATYNNGERSIVFATEEVYSGFFRLVRRLLLTNYDLTNAELTTVLTVNNEQLRILFEAVFKHLLRQ